MKYYSQVKDGTRKEHKSEVAARRYATNHCGINPYTGKRNRVSVKNHRYGDNPYVIYYAN